MAGLPSTPRPPSCGAGTISVDSDGTGRLTLASLPRRNGEVDNRQVRRASGVFRVNVRSGRTVIVLTAPFGSASKKFSCAKPSGRLADSHWARSAWA